MGISYLGSKPYAICYSYGERGPKTSRGNSKIIIFCRSFFTIEALNMIFQIASKTKLEMNEFVSYYRRSAGVNGKQSFSLLYTSINVLAGHYTSYGVKFPVPEKRRKRLLQVHIFNRQKAQYVQICSLYTISYVFLVGVC